MSRADGSTPTAVGQIALLVTDLAATERFYGEVLGLTHLYTFGDLIFFSCGDTRLFLRVVPAAEWTAGSLVYLQVGDTGAAYERLSTAGVAFVEGPHVIHTHEDGTQEWMAFFHDPAGNLLAVMSQDRPVS